ncbi:hypothetical protein N0V90_003148 [Kalmusia sp. IMI 367209]|nr:hypothetical protein N0V90_003148 [Kalmusia sp. IMI 367209]
MPPKSRPRRMIASQTNMLLSKQLASISTTLANASKRRDIETKERASRGASPTTSRASTPMPSIEPSSIQVTTEFTTAHTSRVPPGIVGPELPCTKIDRERERRIPREYIYYTIPLQLESAGCDWEKVKGWTTYLFSGGSTGHSAVRHRNQIIDEAAKELDAIITKVLNEESAYCANEEKTMLPYRLIVTNIAASAGTDELAWLFYDFKFNIRHIKLLEVRDPVKRTQTAHIDMQTRHAARQASFTMGSIYGLMVKVHLATEKE